MNCFFPRQIPFFCAASLCMCGYIIVHRSQASSLTEHTFVRNEWDKTEMNEGKCNGHNVSAFYVGVGACPSTFGWVFASVYRHMYTRPNANQLNKTNEKRKAWLRHVHISTIANQ